METNPYESPTSDPSPVHQSFRLTRDPNAPEIPSVGSREKRFYSPSCNKRSCSSSPHSCLTAE